MNSFCQKQNLRNEYSPIFAKTIHTKIVLAQGTVPMSARLQLNLLGAPEVFLEERTVSFETNKSQALLFYLALNPGWHSRDLLAELLWPDMTTSRARKNLRDGLTQLRASVGSWILTDAQRAGFAYDIPYELDVKRLQDALRQGRARVDLSLVEAAVKLYRGDFLIGFHVRKAQPFEEWVMQKREELHAQFINGLEWLIQQYFIQQDYTAGLTANRRLLNLEPWQESAHQVQMHLLALTGRTHDALAQYKICQRVLAEELDVQPSPETVALYEQIRAGQFSHQPAEIPTLKRDEPHKESAVQQQPLASKISISLSNLPRQMTPLIGREMEITVLSSKLTDPRYPLITLSGEGGVGKTRLAVAIGETLQAHFADGVWFVPLADISPPTDLPNQLAAGIGKALQLTFAGAEPLIDQLFTQLRPKQLLLILDNFEHLLTGATFILDLLHTAHHIKILVTSRRRLNFQAEYFFQLDGLAFPDEEEATEATNGLLEVYKLLTYPSVALFVERANRIHQQFNLTAENQADVLYICQLVAGLPLGIELAAALLRHLTMTQIAAVLRHNYAALSTTFPDLPLRHRSIRAVIDYSRQLLSMPEIQTLTRCAVFRGGFTGLAAQAVTGATPEILASLTDHSLLHQTVMGRFEVHELVRQYAAEQLLLHPIEAAQVYNLHSTYYTEFLALLEQSQNRDRTAQLAIRTELDNIRAAWLWAVEQARVAELARALKSLARFYYLVGFLSEAVTMLTAAITCVRTLLAGQAQPDPYLQQLLGQLLGEESFFEAMLGRRTVAEQFIQEAIQLAQVLDDPGLEALGHLRLGDIAWSRANYPLHRAAYTHSLQLARKSNLLPLEAHCLSNLGMSHDQYGEYPEAITCYKTALAIARHLGNRQQESIVYNNLGVSFGMLGDFGQSLHYHQQTLQLSRELGDQEGLGFAYLNQGSVWCVLGEETRAQAALSQALTLFQTMKLTRLEAKTLTAFAHLYKNIGNYTLAQSYCEQAIILAEPGGYQTVQAEALILMGYILVTQETYGSAIEAYSAALNLWQAIDQVAGQLPAQAGLAKVYLQQHNYTSALEIVERILAVLEYTHLNAIQHLGRIFLICYQTLAANHDARAVDVLRRGGQLLRDQAATLDDPALQHSFLYNVLAHRKLMEELALHTMMPALTSPSNA